MNFPNLYLGELDLEYLSDLVSLKKNMCQKWGLNTEIPNHLLLSLCNTALNTELDQNNEASHAAVSSATCLINFQICTKMILTIMN